MQTANGNANRIKLDIVATFKVERDALKATTKVKNDTVALQAWMHRKGELWDHSGLQQEAYRSARVKKVLLHDLAAWYLENAALGLKRILGFPNNMRYNDDGHYWIGIPMATTLLKHHLYNDTCILCYGNVGMLHRTKTKRSDILHVWAVGEKSTDLRRLSLQHKVILPRYNVVKVGSHKVDVVSREYDSIKEVILNGDSPAPTRVVEGVVQSVAPTTAKQRLARKNELKARGTLLMDLPDKHHSKFNIHKDAKNLMEEIEKRFGGNKETNKRIRRILEENRPTSMGFDMSKVKCYNCHRKGHFARECRSPKDTRRTVAAEPQRRNVSVETSKSNALVSQCDGVGSYDWIFQAEEEPTNYALMAFTSSSSSSSDNEVVSCLKSCTKAYATLQSHYDKLTNELRKSQFDVLSYQTGLESVEARLLVYQQNETVFEENIKLLKLDIKLRDKALVILRHNDELFDSKSDESLHVSPPNDRYQSRDGYHAVPPPYTGTFMPPKPDLVFHNAPNVNETVHTAFNVELSPTKPNTDLSHTHRSSAPIIEDWVSNLEDDSEPEILQNAPSFVQPTKQVKPPRPSVQHVETSIPAANHKTIIPKPKSHGNNKNRKACFVCKSLAHLIKDLLTQSKLVSIIVVRLVTTVVPKTNVTRPRQAKSFVTKPHSPFRRHITHSQSPKTSNFLPKVTVAKAPMGNPQHALKDKGVIDSGCSRNMTGNMSYLSDFEEINGGYVAFGRNLKGGKISRKGKTKTGKLDFDDVYFVKELKFNLFSVSQMCDKKNNVLFTDTERIVLSPEFKLPDENQVLLRVPRENNMYNVDLKNIVPSGNLTCKFDGKADEGFLVRYSNTDGDAAFEEKEPEFEGRKPESEVHVSLSSSAQRKKHDDKTKKEAKGKSLVESLTRYRNLSAEFEDFFDNSINEVNATGNSITAVGPTHGKSSYMDASQLPDDPNMPELEDITYSDDEEDVGAEVDFTNLETTITVSPIPTTKIHKDHPVTQIIGDLSSATQTKSMTRVAKDQGTKWVFRNKKDERGIVVRNKARLVAQGHTQEEGIDYEEVFAPVEMIEAITLFLAYASFMGFMVYQMDVKSAFLYREEEVYVCQPPRFEDPDYPDKVYKVVKALYGLHQAPRACQDKYVDEILRKFGLTDGKSASTPVDTEKPLLKDPDGEDVDVHTYRLMIGSLMYLTSSRPDIMFAVYTCVRSQVTSKFSHLHAVKRIFIYLKGKLHLGLWYLKDSPFNLVAYLDSDYAGASLDRKSTTGRCQFLGCNLISWQCKKQTVVATSSTEA
nr:hypothetical protein [Tanacetum cinerariifolium]